MEKVFAVKGIRQPY